MLDAVEAAEKPPDFVGVENDGQLRCRLRGRDDLGEHPVLLERDPERRRRAAIAICIELGASFPFSSKTLTRIPGLKRYRGLLSRRRDRNPPLLNLPFLSHRRLT
jgi:hypothetical protein